MSEVELREAKAIADKLVGDKVFVDGVEQPAGVVGAMYHAALNAAARGYRAALSQAQPDEAVERPIIMLEIAEADDEHQKWLRRCSALKQMYPPERPCFVDQDGDWCLRDFIDYAAQAMGDHLRANPDE